MKEYAFEDIQEIITSSDTVLVDLRPMDEYAKKHIRGSVNVEYHVQHMDVRLELMIPQNIALVFTCPDDDKSKQVFESVSSTGKYKCLGIFPQGVDAWKKMGGETHSYDTISAKELKRMMDDEKEVTLIDCRLDFEWDMGYIEGSQLIDASKFWKEASSLDAKGNYVLICNTGINSGMGVSILKNKYDFNQVCNVEGGLIEWKKNGFPIFKP